MKRLRFDCHHYHVVGCYGCGKFATELAEFFVLPEITHGGGQVRGIFQLSPIYFYGLFTRPAIEEHDCTAAVGERSRPDFQIAVFPHTASFATERVLID